jgi:hypothetical protein
MVRQTAADLTTHILHSVGVRRIYGVVGGRLNGIVSHPEQLAPILAARRKQKPLEESAWLTLMP